MDSKPQLAIIGLGKMGGAIARHALNTGYEVMGYDTDISLGQQLATNYANFKIAYSLDALLSNYMPLLLAVKPSLVKSMAAAISDDRLLISIAAGISIAQLRNNRLSAGPVIRAMPNTPLVVGKGMTALCASEDCTLAHKEFAFSLFAAAGECLFLESENLMHIVTGLSGSGPAYVYLFLQALEDVGVQGGLPRQLARKMALQTVAGAAELCRIAQRSPQELIHDVTSPGGTTIVGLTTLKEERFETAVHRAVLAAARQSEKLAE